MTTVTAKPKTAKQIAHEERNAQAKTAAAARRIQRGLDHDTRNAITAAAAIDARAERMHDHDVANLVASLKAADRRFASAELHREWNAEEHYAAVAMRAMKQHSSQAPASTAPVAANDDQPLQAAA